MVIIPLRKPMQILEARVIRKAITGGTPEFAKYVSKKVANPKTDPTDRSNSPEIIKKDVPMAINPNSADIVNMEVMEERVRNLLENDEKITINITSVNTTANSGCFITTLKRFFDSLRRFTIYLLIQIQ